ncbi:bifunctional tetrahydrofolate synthase/dihydrofolate synthase [soil metagenome]
MRFNTLEEWLTWLSTLHPRAIDLGLGRVACVAERLQLLPYSLPVITVAGTNGKGSCVTLLESILLAAGYRVGSYFSPHLLRYNERIRSNGHEISDAALCNIFQKIDSARGKISLTYFEFGTLAALLHFKQLALDIAVLEVGLGGRLDAVNIVDASLAIISTIDMDHMDWLGADRESIAKEKAGILRAERPAICGDLNVPVTLKQQAERQNSPLYCQGIDFGYHDEGDTWSWWQNKQIWHDLPKPTIQLQNAATVLTGLQHLSSLFVVTRSAIEQGLKQAYLPGRLQNITVNGISCLLDVAHNPQSANLLAHYLQTKSIKGRNIVVIGMLADKDIAASIAPMLSLVDEWYVAGLDVARGASTEMLYQVLLSQIDENAIQSPSPMNTSEKGTNKWAIHTCATVEDAFQQALTQASAIDRIVVYGSFYTVAKVMLTVA